MVRAGLYSLQEPLQGERNFLAVPQAGHPRHPHSPPPLSHIFCELAAANTRCLHLAGLKLKKGAYYKGGKKISVVISMSSVVLAAMLYARMRMYRQDILVYFILSLKTPLSGKAGLSRV